MMTNLGELIKSSAEKYPDKTAFEIKRGIRVDRFSFSQMNDLALRMAFFLKKQGVGRGDRVVILAPNMPEYVLVFFGCWLAGVIVVPIDLRTTKETIKKFVKLTSPKLGFTSKYISHPLKDFDFPSFFLEDLVDQVKNLSQTQPAQVEPEDVAEIVFTSGTTGTPKGVVLTHKNLLFDLEKGLKVFPLKSSWRVLSLLPLSHALTQMVDLLVCFGNGMKVVYLTRLNPLTIKKAIKKHQIACMGTVPQLLSLLLKSIKEEARQKQKLARFEKALRIASALPFFFRRLLFREIHQGLGGKFRFFVCGSAPLDLKLAQAWENMGIKIYEAYGATEMTAALTLNTPQDQKLGSVGKVLPEMEVKIDQEGEIWTKGENISPGYFANPQKTKEAFIDGWYKSGDIGFFDSQGYLYISGRTAFKIVLPSGLKVYPEDVEKKLKQHPLVEEACLVGARAEKGEVPHAVIVTSKPSRVEQIVAEVNQNLEEHQRIFEASVWPEEDFPRTPILKIDRNKVLEWVEKKSVGLKAPRTPPDFAWTKSWRAGKKEEKKDELREILAEVSEVEVGKIGPKSNLVSDLKLDSLARVELVSLIEERLGVYLNEDKITTQTTVSQLKKMVKTGEKARKEEIPDWQFSKVAIWIREIFQRFFFLPLYGYFVKIDVQGKENLAQASLPVIIIFNHLGPWDIFSVYKILPSTLRKKLVGLGDARYFKLWGGLLGFLAQFLGGALVVAQEEKVKRAGLEKAGELVAEGFSVIISPEGTFSKTGKLGEFKPGAGMLAVELRLPVIPIKISPNYQEIFSPTPFGAWQRYVPTKREKVMVKIGKPLFFSKDIAYLKAAKIMREKMEEL
jgi:long-chain acyl-CoA synthetase